MPELTDHERMQGMCHTIMSRKGTSKEICAQLGPLWGAWRGMHIRLYKSYSTQNLQCRKLFYHMTVLQVAEVTIPKKMHPYGSTCSRSIHTGAENV